MIKAFSNPEYMTLKEINESLASFKRIDSANNSNTNSMKRRLVPLPPPPSHAPAPPPSPPPILNRPKIYQNIDSFNQHIRHNDNIPTPIHIDCDFFPTPRSLSNRNDLLITTNNNSLMYLISNNANNNSTTSDSSSATMIVKKSPTYYKSSVSSSGSFNYDLEEEDRVNDDLLCRKAALRAEKNSKLIGSLSPIMTSSRADLNAYNTSRSLATLMKNGIHEEEEDDYDERLTTLINNKTPPHYDSSPQKLITNSLPCNRIKQKFKRLSFSKEQDNENQETTLIDNNLKSFNNYNYELVLTEKDDLSVESLILLPPSPFKSTETPQNKSNIKQSMCSDRLKSGSTKKVSFMIRDTHHTRSIEQFYYDDVFEEEDDEFLTSTEEEKEHHLNHLRRQRRHSLSSGSSSSCSTNSSINIASNSILKSKIVFSNNHYFISTDKESSASSSSSSIPAVSCSSSSSCSSTSSSSSGYKSNQSASIHHPNQTGQYVLNPNELDHFIKVSRDRLERLKMKRFQLVTENKLTQPNDEADFVKIDSTLRRKEPKPTVNQTASSNYVDSLLFKNVSAKLFQKLLSSKSSLNSPCSTLPRRSK